MSCYCLLCFDMSFRQICKETSKLPLKVLLFFSRGKHDRYRSNEANPGKGLEVKVNWQGRKVRAQIFLYYMVSHHTNVVI